MANLLALDVGTKWIGVAMADPSLPIAIPLETITVDGNEVSTIAQLVKDHEVTKIVIGYPRNQQGEATDQTSYAENFGRQLKGIAPIVFQDESLTSVIAEDRLKQSGKPYQKADIDALAATIILQDYLEMSANG